MKKTQTHGGKRIEVQGLECLSDIQVKETTSRPLPDHRVKALLPLVKRALLIAADSAEEWLSEAVSYDDSGLSISYHLVWSEIPEDFTEGRDYVTEEEFLELCKEINNEIKSMKEDHI